MRHIVIIATLVATLAARPGFADPFTFDTIPSDGSLTAVPGATVGWGYAITNPSTTLWLVITGLSADTVQHGLLDTSVFDFPVLAPLASIAQPFDGASFLGLASFTPDAGAPDGFVNAGVFELDAEFFDGDPFQDGQFVDAAETASATYAVTAQRAPPIPEPPTAALVMLAIGMAAARRRVKRPASRPRT